MRVGRSVPSCILGMFVLNIFFVMSPSAQQPPVSQLASPQRKVPPPAPTAQEQFLVYWTTEAGWSTELLLRNNLEASPLTVTPALRTPGGAETSLPAVTIQSGDVASIDLYSVLLKVAPQLTGAWGSLVLRYSSTVNGGLYASAMVRADGRPIAFHLDAYARGTKYDVGSREGIWWLPWATVTDYLILTNSGEQSVQTNLVLYDSSGKAWQQRLSLTSHETRRLSVRTLLQQAGLQGSHGGIKIDMAKDARYLDSAHLLFEESGSFSAVMKMFRHDPSTTLASRSFAGAKEWTTRAPMLALSNPDPALGFPAGTTLQPKIFIRNASAKTFTAHLRLNWRSAIASGKSASLDLPLNTNETKLIDVAALQAQNLLPSDANWAAVILSAPVLPDELLAVAASYDQTGRYGAQTPFNDQLAPHWEAGQWEVDGTRNSLVTITNGGSKPEVAQLTILYNQGSSQYQLEQMLAPDEQMLLDFGKLIHDHVPDKNGQFLPANLTSGAYRILDLTDHAAGGLYEGKVIVDKRYGHAAYGCGICCGPRTAYMVFNPMFVSIGGSSGQEIDAANSCNGQIVNITGDFPTWWTDNTAIATASGKQINGMAVGATNHNAQSINMYFGPRVDSGGQPCPLDQEQPVAGTNVAPTILLGGSNGTDITNTTQSVVVGQQIVLHGKYTLPSGYTFTSQSWTIPGTSSTPPTAISNFTVASDSSSGALASLTSTQLSQQTVTYYFVAAASSQVVKFTLNYNDSSGTAQSATAQATFNIAGPTNVSVSAPLGQWQINSNSSLDFGFPISPDQGIQFNGSASSPSGHPGTYEWAQLITSDQTTVTAGSSTSTCTAGTGLDNAFPYGTGLSVSDSPSASLPSADSKVTVSDNFTMYLMWRPGLSSDIPVPLGYVTWQIFGDAAQSGGTWTVQSDSTKSANTFAASASYPTWSNKVTNGGPQTCH